MVSNRRLVPQGDDFYPTPPWGTRALLRYEDFSGTILEPCCGDGAMSEVLKETGCNVVSSDIVDRGYGDVRDFLSYDQSVANIVTNPPFNVAEVLLEHALRLAQHKVCFLLRTAFLESKRRYENFYQYLPPARILVFTERLSMYPKGQEVNGGGTTSYSWFVWDTSVAHGDTQVIWIAPGYKPRKTS